MHCNFVIPKEIEEFRKTFVSPINCNDYPQTLEQTLKQTKINFKNLNRKTRGTKTSPRPTKRKGSDCPDNE